jgi:hypothetical protein
MFPNEQTTDEQEHEQAASQEKAEQNQEKKAKLFIGEKILDYRKHLHASPPTTFPIAESELHRQEMALQYPSISQISTKLLDIRLYNYFLGMQKVRDLKFSSELGSPNERTKRLAKFMLRLATPVVFLNHNHEINIFYPEGIKVTSTTPKISTPRSDFLIADEIIRPILTQQELLALREQIKRKLFSKDHWSKEELSNTLTHAEADILSQMLAEGEDIDMFIITASKLRFSPISPLQRPISQERQSSFAWIIEPQQKHSYSQIGGNY